MTASSADRRGFAVAALLALVPVLAISGLSAVSPVGILDNAESIARNQGVEPRFVLRTIDGRVLRGVIAAETRDDVFGLTVAVDEQPAVWLALDEVLEIERETQDAPVLPPALAEIRLRSGGLLRGKSVEGSADETLRVALVGANDVSIDVALHHIEAMRLLREAQPGPATFLTDLAEPPGASDYLYVEDNGVARRFSVTVRKIQDADLAFDFSVAARTVPLNRVLGVVFGTATGLAPDPQPGVHVAVTTTGGSRMTGRLTEFTNTLALLLDEGTAVRLPVAQVQTLTVASDRLAMLSTMNPSEVTQTAALDRVWPWLRDRSFDPDGIIQLGGERHARGLVMVPRTRLTFTLDKPFDRFETTVGIEDDAGRAAHAICRVLVDDKVVWERTFARETPPETLSLSIAGAKSIALETDFGARFDLCDYCVFGSPRLLR